LHLFLFVLITFDIFFWSLIILYHLAVYLIACSYYKLQEYQKMRVLLMSLLKVVKKSDDKRLLVEIHLLESECFVRLHDLSKARVCSLLLPSPFHCFCSISSLLPFVPTVFFLSNVRLPSHLLGWKQTLLMFLPLCKRVSTSRLGCCTRRSTSSPLPTRTSTSRSKCTTTWACWRTAHPR
jgi:hypothetical protein